MRGSRGIRFAVAAVVAVVLGALPSTALGQAPVTVTANVFTDEVPSSQITPASCTPAHCTLREAVHFESPAQIVQLLPGRYELAQAQPLDVDGVKTINGSGATIDANSESGAVKIVEGAEVIINDVTITGGNATGQSPQGGGIYVQNPSSLELNRSTVAGNRASGQGGGIYTQSNDLVQITDSTISANVIVAEIGGAGGGIYGTSPSDLKLFNTTVSGNQVPGLRTAGAGVFAQGALEMTHVTIAGNVTTGSGLSVSSVSTSQPPLAIWNTIVAADTGSACDISNRPFTGDHNLDHDGTCGFSRLGDKPGQNPLLGPLQSNGGTTATQALMAGSPAIDAADSPHCRATDQRGVARPQLAACDMGAFEYVPPPPPSSPPPPPGDDGQLPPPEIRKTVNVVPKSGTVRVKRRGARRFVKLTEGQQIPLGSTVDTLRGRVTLTAAANGEGGTATADFYEGIFVVRQTKGRRPTTRLILSEKLICPKAGTATTAARRKRKRRLWGNGSGRFRTEGEYSSATVRGTIWLTQDHCNRTLTKVRRGKVAVRDFARKKTIIVRAGGQYIARARP